MGGERSGDGEDGKILPSFLQLFFLKTLTAGAVTAEAGSLYQYFKTLSENADTLLASIRSSKAAFSLHLPRVKDVTGREKINRKKFGSLSKKHMRAVTRSV